MAGRSVGSGYSRVGHRQSAERRIGSSRSEHERDARSRRTDGSAVIVLKLGGDLLEEPSRLQGVVLAVATIAGRTPLAIVHGGGKEIDVALHAAGIAKRQVDGLRITDDPTLEVVVSVLAGTINTRLVAALTTAGVAAVGLSGADDGCGLADPAPP